MNETLHEIPSAYLVPYPTETCSKPVRLEPGVMSVGRSLSCSIHLAHGAVSRNHAEISWVNAQYVLTDLKSRNGTFINNKRVKKSGLRDGDKISFGDRSFIFSIKNSEMDDTISFSFSSLETVRFSEDDFNISDMVAQKAEVAAHTFLNPRKTSDDFDIEKALEAHSRLSILHQLSDQLRTARNTDEILTLGTDLIFDALSSAERAVAMLRSGPKDPIEARIVKYRDKRPEGEVIPVSQTVINRVIEEKLAVVSRDAFDDSRFKMADSIRIHSLKSIVCVPFIVRDWVIGVLHLDTSQLLNSFNNDDLEFTAAVANEMAMSIENLRLQREAVKNERMAAIGLTITNIAHNIKNLLTMNKGAEDLMEIQLKNINNEKVNNSWKIVQQCLEQINKLAMNMLDFTRTQPARLIRININEKLQAYQRLYEENFIREGNTVVLDLDPRIEEWVIDEEGLRRAMLNLVVNANDALKGKKDGRITISTIMDEQKRLNIKVSDNGAGIDDDKIKHVFQLFYTTKGTSGSGLGLPSVQRFVERLGGSISVNSEKGKGSEFQLNIPWLEENQDI